jgi:hypothetical protein
VVARRIELIESDKSIGLIGPDFKRRWNSPRCEDRNTPPCATGCLLAWCSCGRQRPTSLPEIAWRGGVA